MWFGDDDDDDDDADGLVSRIGSVVELRELRRQCDESVLKSRVYVGPWTERNASAEP